MGLREDIAAGIERLAEWLLEDPADAELWPDERLRLHAVVDHIHGLDRRPPEKRPLADVRIKIGRYTERVPRRWTGPSRFRVRTKATGRQLVRYARWTITLVDSLALRGVEAPAEVLELVGSLRDTSDAAATIVALRGEVL